MDAAREYTDREVRRMAREMSLTYGREGDAVAGGLVRYLTDRLEDGRVPRSALAGQGWAEERRALAGALTARNAESVRDVSARMGVIRDLTAKGAPRRSRVPSPGLDRARDVAWNERHVEAAARAAVGRDPSVAAAGMRALARMNMNSAVRRARTAVNGAENAGRMDGMLERGGYKRWVAVMDERTRASHASLNGEVVPVAEPFSNGLMYPGDPSGPPEEVCNCRCSMEWVSPEEAEGDAG